MNLFADRENVDDFLPALAHVIEDPQGPQTQLPGCDRVRPQRFSIPGLPQRLVSELLLDPVEDPGSFGTAERCDLRHDGSCDLNRVCHLQPIARDVRVQPYEHLALEPPAQEARRARPPLKPVGSKRLLG